MPQNKDTKITVDKIENLIRTNKISEANESIVRLSASKPARDSLLGLARMARMVGNYSLALRTLHPHHESEAEKVEYAAALVGMGAYDEAKTKLKDISNDPQKNLIAGWLALDTWNLKEAVTALNQFHKNPKADELQKQWGELLLARAHVLNKDYSDANTLLKQLSQSAKGPENAWIAQSAAELTTQLAITQENWGEAEGWAEKLTDFGKILWKSILEVKKTKGSPESLGGLKESKKDAVLRKQWEAARFCDLMEGLALRDEKLLSHLYFGTPHVGYRQYLANEFGRTPALPSEYFWQPRGAKGVGVTFDLFKGTLDNGKASLKVGQTLHRLLVCLCSDFYRPLRIATIHSEIFPNATYHPTSSPTRVHQVIKRLRQWVESEQVPLLLESEVGVYQLVGTGPCRIRISESNGSKDQANLVYQKIQDCFGDKAFSSAEVATAFNLSTRSARRVLSKLVSTGLLECFGSGTSTRYSKPRLKAAA